MVEVWSRSGQLGANEFRSSFPGGFYHFGNGIPRSPSQHSKTRLAVNGRGPEAWFALGHYLGEMFPRNRGSPAACIAKQAAPRDKIRPTVGRRTRGRLSAVRKMPGRLSVNLKP